MQITKQECLDFAKDIFKRARKGEITTEKDGAFLTWGHKMLDGLEENPDANVDLPLEFQSIFRDAQIRLEADLSAS